MAKEKTLLLLKINESGNNFPQWQIETLVEELGSAYPLGRGTAQGKTLEECLTKAIGPVHIAAPGSTLSKDEEDSNTHRSKAGRTFRFAESKMFTHVLTLISPATRDWLASKSLMMSGATRIDMRVTANTRARIILTRSAQRGTSPPLGRVWGKLIVV